MVGEIDDCRSISSGPIVDVYRIIVRECVGHRGREGPRVSLVTRWTHMLHTYGIASRRGRSPVSLEMSKQSV